MVHRDGAGLRRWRGGTGRGGPRGASQLVRPGASAVRRAREYLYSRRVGAADRSVRLGEHGRMRGGSRGADESLTTNRTAAVERADCMGKYTRHRAATRTRDYGYWGLGMLLGTLPALSAPVFVLLFV